MGSKVMFRVVGFVSRDKSRHGVWVGKGLKGGFVLVKDEVRTSFVVVVVSAK